MLTNTEDSVKALTEGIFHYLHPTLTNMMPEYIGSFTGEHELPEREYPATYYWINTTQDDDIQLCFNLTLLEEICQLIGMVEGIDVTHEIQVCAIATFVDLVSIAFELTIALDPELFD